MKDLTQKQILELIYSEFKDYKEDWKEYKEKQEKINELVIRHDEKIKGIWKIPVISGGVVSIIGGIGIFVSSIL